ncbi:MAG: hypothetical protein K9W42_13810 [Candidatus Heimdallarchaeota archaeon]|nr:hypothetical protein [Candidatus Heimdallarchaeota archaeon]
MVSPEPRESKEKQGNKKSTKLQTVIIPEELVEQFQKAETKVKQHFATIEWDPTNGRILIGGERYVFIRASSLRIGFPQAIASLLELDGGMNNPLIVKLIYEIAKSLGKADAKKFHLSMGLDDPIEKLSTGPIHFAFTGWAKVDIMPESHPIPDGDYYLIYTHPQSFEADSFILSKGETSVIPICVMNAGYSAGWCSESFGLDLDAQEITCRAKGDKECLFIMAPKDKLEQKVVEYLDAKKKKE